MVDIAIHAHGDAVAGMGHIIRQLVLARELRARGLGVVFVTPADTPGGRRVAQDGFACVDTALATLAISDVPCGPDVAALTAIHPHTRRIVVFIGSGQILAHPDLVRGHADLVIEQSVMPPDNTVPQTVGGGGYLLIDPRYAQVRGCADGPIVVCYGGRDFLSLTEPTVAALAGCRRDLRVVTGPARKPLDWLPAMLEVDVQAVHAPESLVSVLSGAALYVGAFGMSALEALACGVPVVCSGWSDDHVRSVEYLQSLEVARSLGRAENFNAELVRIMAGAWPARRAWQWTSDTARALIDGQGARRCADVVMGVMR